MSKEVLFEKIKAVHAKERNIPADSIELNESENSVMFYSQCRTVGEYVWNSDKTCLIRVKYVLKESDDRRGETFDSYHEAWENIRSSVHSDLMGSVTFSIDKIFTTAGVPY